MYKFKNVIVITFLMFLTLPAFSIEATQEQSTSVSTNMLDISDFTGDNFFRSGKELQRERDNKIEQDRLEYNRNFVPTRSPFYDYTTRKTMAPVKKLRLKANKYMKNRAERTANKKKLKSSDIASENIEEEENSVEEEEKELLGSQQIIIKCKVMKYLPETNDIEATGNLSITFPEQDTVVYGKRMTYNNYTNVIQIYDDVKILRNGSETLGDYLKFNLNEESGVLNNLKFTDYNIKLIAEHGYMFGDTVITEKGKIKTEHDQFITFSSEGFSSDIIQNIIIPQDEYKYLLNDLGVSKFFIKVDEINIKANANNDVIKLKRPKIYTTKGKKLVSLPSMTIYSNKEHDYVEGNYPELGSLATMGMFAGPGLVLPMPFGSTLKILPTVNYKSGFGFGGIARFKSGTNTTNFAYNTAAKKFYLKGEQQLDDFLTLQYGANSYMNNWILGQEWVGYGGQLVYERGYSHADFIYKDAPFTFSHRITAAFLKENKRTANNMEIPGVGKMSTARFRYMAQANQNIYSHFKHYDPKELTGWKMFDINLLMDGSAAIYGTGDTQFVARIGPRLSTQYKNWRQDIGYYLSGYSDNTPMPTMDAYRFGRSSVYLREYWRACKYLTLGLYTTYSFDDGLKDYQSRSDTKFKEASFYVALGPDDFKLNLGYDFIRENTYFGFTVAMNPKGTEIDYNKMTVKNADDLGKTKDEPNVFPSYGFIPPPSPYRSNAVVVDMEDATTVMKGENL